MAEKRRKRPRDPVQLAKLVGDIATGQVEDIDPSDKHPPYVARGRKGGQKGGKARASKLTAEQRSEIARIAANARWKKREDGD